MGTIEPLNVDRNFIGLGRRKSLSELDIRKIKKLYKCPPYHDWYNVCQSDDNCGINEYCGPSNLLIGGQCRTVLADGSFCTSSKQCLNICSGGRCTNCNDNSHCKSNEFCANVYYPLMENHCSDYCEELCMFNSQCGGSCPVCSWRFRCEKS